MTTSSESRSRDEAFLSAFNKSVSSLGDYRKHKRFWGEKIGNETFGCIGFTSYVGPSPAPLNACVGVRFEAVENAYDEIVRPFIPPHVIPGLLSRYVPTVPLDMMRLASTPQGNGSPRATSLIWLTESNAEVLGAELAATFASVGKGLITKHSSIKKSAEALIKDLKCNSITARKLPIMLFLLGRELEARELMALASTWSIPIGNYAEFRAAALSYFIS